MACVGNGRPDPGACLRDADGNPIVVAGEPLRMFEATDDQFNADSIYAQGGIFPGYDTEGAGWSLGDSADILSLGATNASLNRQTDIFLQELNFQYLTINGSANQVAPEVELALWFSGEKAAEIAASGVWRLGKSGVNLFRGMPESGGVSSGLSTWLRGDSVDAATMYPEFVVPSKPATGSGYLTSDSRIARYEQHLDRLQENGYQNTEKLGEYSGRINMLKEGYVLAGDGKLVGNKLNPGYGKGTQGIDRIYSNVNDSYDFAILESKYRTIFTDGENPLTLLPQTKKSGQQMSTPWIMNNINKMTGPNQGVRLNNLGDDLLLNGYNNRYLNVLNGSGQRFMFNLDDYGLK